VRRIYKNQRRLNFQTPPGQKEYLFIDFTGMGRKLLET
jgi:hypothetical protein